MNPPPTEPSELPELERLPRLAFADARVLFETTRSCLGYPLVLQGRIKVFKAFPNGRELLLYHVTAGQPCVVSAACLLSGTTYAASAVAQGDVVLRLVPAALFDALMERATFRRLVMLQFTQRLSDLMLLVDAVYTHRLDQRLAARPVARRDTQGDVLALTHQQLADALGGIREVVSRMPKQFADQGWISSERGVIQILAPQALRDHAAAPE